MHARILVSILQEASALGGPFRKAALKKLPAVPCWVYPLIGARDKKKGWDWRDAKWVKNAPLRSSWIRSRPCP